MILREEGLEAVWARHTVLARAVWAAVRCWSEGGAIRFNIAKDEDRSVAVTTVHMDEKADAR